jgi:hypothetical protein
MYLQNAGGEIAKAAENGIDGLAYKGLGLVVVKGDELGDGGFRFAHAVWELRLIWRRDNSVEQRSNWFNHSCGWGWNAGRSEHEAENTPGTCGSIYISP